MGVGWMVLWHKAVETPFKVDSDGGICVLIQGQCCGGMLNKELEHSDFGQFWKSPFDLAGDQMEPPRIRGQDDFYLIPLVLGIMLVMRLSNNVGWISRWPLAVIVGWTAGSQLPRVLDSDFTRQVAPLFKSLIVFKDGSLDLYSPQGTLAAFVIVFGTLCALIYFFFSVEHKGVFGHMSKIGIWILMVTFGAAFGYTVMGRIALLVGRVEFLIVDFLKLTGG